MIKGRSFNLQAPLFAGSRSFPDNPPSVIPVTEKEARDLLDTRGVYTSLPPLLPLADVFPLIC